MKLATKKLATKQRAFLASFAQTASITKAAAAAQVDRAMHYRWLRESEPYATAFEAGKDEAGQTLEDEAVRRAHEGVLEPVFYKGKPVGVIRIYSDTLLLSLLKAFRPEKYRERSEITGPNGGPLRIERIERVIVDPLLGVNPTNKNP